VSTAAFFNASFEKGFLQRTPAAHGPRVGDAEAHAHGPPVGVEA
jgi:hypothetical protein